VIAAAQVIARVPFTTVGWVLPVALLRDGHLFYVHVVLPPFFKSLRSDQQVAVQRRAEEKALAAMDELVIRVLGQKPQEGGVG
jgi:hypothetical protein